MYMFFKLKDKQIISFVRNQVTISGIEIEPWEEKKFNERERQT